MQIFSNYSPFSNIITFLRTFLPNYILHIKKVIKKISNKKFKINNTDHFEVEHGIVIVLHA